MIDLTDAFMINRSELHAELEKLAPLTHGYDPDWTPESRIVAVTLSNWRGQEGVTIEIQHDQVIWVEVNDFTVATYLPNTNEWHTYGVEPDETNFEHAVAEQIIRDIIGAFN